MSAGGANIVGDGASVEDDGASDELRELFLNSTYPEGFASRKPKHCGGGAFGCDSCLQDVEQSDSAEDKHVFCRCMMMADFLASGEPDDFQPFSAHAQLTAPAAAHQNVCLLALQSLLWKIGEVK